ncbi:lipid IV(A) 4-amino-4-deoxy-L-arabinosyltransferase [Enterobacter sp. DTU_2021_1002640_1_SI_PRY_ASU_LCPMC_013]|uniref:lipid IV(A) 4-amino-4-deoxy-L-arabinosyltransferase n=1 Tax=Enterobacter sp. DTU_2021_1002640_1_SI_PRY_ASU_LCPMC_013 TaxID=3077940 RepID=UPI0028E21028|nr:lipid IV(A) 4-amino-4-deoxy-L-arabinosyltransferase [Enterobacter sp. DTU_2021_1002640_1_SI_PRY_ASU_LCPMC_013]WNU99074.1 lipid IV(A) 4-amino-4-deoxy-L-arabinosyltransferase [Enterobacter sp. DTU_2021_1002640_1_SI_PRY_ASU_LCPMC_013]
MSKKNNCLILLISGFTLFYLLPLNLRMLWQPDETRYAEISREMLASGDWIVPHLFGLRYFEKPVMGYWINNIGQWIFGDSNLAVRSGSVLSITLSAVMVAWFAWSQWKNRRLAVMSAVIYLTFLLVYGVGTYAVLDPMLTLWLTAAMCAFWKTTLSRTVRGKIFWYLLLGVLCGMGVMTKGFLALVVPVVAVIPWICLMRNWKQVVTYGWLAVFSALLITLPWAIAIALREPDFWNYFFWVEHIQRLADSDAAQHKAPFWYYIPVIILGTLPWLGLLPHALHHGWTKKASEPALFYLLGWVVMPLIFFSIAKGKLLTYILPCFAPLALLMAHAALHLQAVHSKIFKANAWINIVFGVIGLIALFFSSVMPRPLYSSAEPVAFYSALIAFAFWSAGGIFALCSGQRGWVLSALCPLGVALLIGYAVPQHIIDSKQPQHFIQTLREPLSASRYILSNNPGVAAGLAWELKRSDIYFFDHKGEMDYGLSYPDSSYKYISASDFDEWLRLHRSEGDISLVLLAGKHDNDVLMHFPEPDYVFRSGRFIYLEYNQRP